MSLRDELAAIITPFGASGFEKADKVLALLRERGQPMWCSSFLCNEWTVDDETEGSVARFVLLDLGEEQTQ